MKPSPWQESLRALELGVMIPGVHQRPLALPPIWGQDWHHQWPRRGIRKLPELNVFLDQRGDPRGPNSQAQQFWSLLDTGGDSAAGTGAFRSSGCSLGFLG